MSLQLRERRSRVQRMERAGFVPQPESPQRFDRVQYVEIHLDMKMALQVVLYRGA